MDGGLTGLLNVNRLCIPTENDKLQRDRSMKPAAEEFYKRWIPGITKFETKQTLQTFGMQVCIVWKCFHWWWSYAFFLWMQEGSAVIWSLTRSRLPFSTALKMSPFPTIRAAAAASKKSELVRFNWRAISRRQTRTNLWFCSRPCSSRSRENAVNIFRNCLYCRCRYSSRWMKFFIRNQIQFLFRLKFCL